MRCRYAPQAQVETHQEDERPSRLLVLRQLRIVEEVTDREATDDIAEWGDEGGECACADVEVLGFESSYWVKRKVGQTGEMCRLERRKYGGKEVRTDVRTVEPGSEEEREEEPHLRVRDDNEPLLHRPPVRFIHRPASA